MPGQTESRYSETAEPLLRSAQAIAAPDDLLGSVWDSYCDGLLVVDTSGVIRAGNPGAEEMFGYGPGEMDGMRVEALLPSEVRDQHQGLRSDYMRSPAARHMGSGFEAVGVRNDGSEMRVDVSLSPFESGGEPLVVAAIQDIGPRKRAEDSLRDHADRQASLAAVTEELVAASLDPDAVLEVVASAVVEELINRIADGGVVFLLSEDQETLEPVTLTYRDAGAAEIYGELLNQNPCRLQGSGAIATAIRELRTVTLVDDEHHLIIDSVDPAYMDGVEQYPLSALVCVPLINAGRAIGAIVMARFRPGQPFDHAEVAYLESISSRISLALENARLHVRVTSANDELAWRATHDSLTGLSDRRLFLEQTQTALNRLGRHPSWSVAVLFMDVDRLKTVNDTYGHAAGDELLKVVASRVSEVTRPGDIVGRFSGDEFLVLLDELDDPVDAVRIVERIRSALSVDAFIAGRRFNVTVSIGVALVREPGDSAQQLLYHADAAMYHAKQQGRDRYEIYNRDLHALTSERLRLEEEMRAGLANGEFSLAYMPEVDLDSGMIEGVEALVRWQHPRHGELPAEQFMDIAESSGVIIALGTWVLEQACRQHSAWRRLAAVSPRVSVNVSARQLADIDLVGEVGRILSETDMAARDLSLEITETGLLADVAVAGDRLAGLHRQGVGIEVDDFGTGYASLTLLRRFPIDRVKIDRSFVEGVALDSDHNAIVRSIIELGHILGLRVIADGVETVEQLGELRRLGCDAAQGFFVSPPRSADQLPALFGGQLIEL